MVLFHERRDFAGLYRVVTALPESPETLYLRAEIYWTCARRSARSDEVLAADRAAKRDKFIAGLARTGPVSQARIDAWDRLNSTPCAGLDVGRFDREEMRRMVAAAADAGDPRAQAWQLAERIERARYESQASRQTPGYDVSEADFQQARQLLASGDPDVIKDLQGMLSSTLSQAVVQIGGVPVDPQSMYAALSLLACDAGAPCGPDNALVTMNCAYRGRCDAGSYYEYLYYYETSPSGAQQIDNYRRALTAMLQSGDLSGIGYSPGSGVPGFNYFFGGRRMFGGGDGNTDDADTAPPPPKALTRRDDSPDA